MKNRYAAIIFGLTIMPVSYAQPGSPGMGCQHGMPGMGCGQGMQWRQGAQPAAQAQANQSQPTDRRLFVKMPAEAQQIMRQDMLIHLSTLARILGFLAEGQLNEAADIAEKQMGNSTKGKHRGTGMGPGRFMPDAMKTFCWNMHQSATDFAQIAKTGNVKAAYAALQQVTATCVTCHAVYRTR